MTILLLGADGQLGSELAIQLRSLGLLAVTTRRSKPASRPFAYQLDLCDANAMRNLMLDVRPRVIVNAAAYTAVDVAESEPQRALAVNAAIPFVLAELANQIGTVLVHYSTDYVFSGAGSRPWREDDPMNPINAYGASKASGEQAIRESNASHLIIRTSWLYGATGRNFVKAMLHCARHRDEIRVVNDQVGSPTSATFVAKTTAQILGRYLTGDADWSPRETLHVSCRGTTTWHGFADAIFQTAADLTLDINAPNLTPVSSTDYPTPARRPAFSPLDTSKLQREFGVLPPDWRIELRNVLPAVYASLIHDSDGPPA